MHLCESLNHLFAIFSLKTKWILDFESGFRSIAAADQKQCWILDGLKSL